MENKIIEKNLTAYDAALTVAGMSVVPEPKRTELMNAMNAFEGWGRCRSLIDIGSTDYRETIAEIMRRQHCTEAVAKVLVNGIQSATLTSFYTPVDVATTITDFCVDAFKALNGKPAKSILDPSAGTGAFLMNVGNYGMSDVITCEKDSLTRTILESKMQLMKDRWYYTTYCEYQHIPMDEEHGGADIIVSNMPFGQVAVSDYYMNTKDAVSKQSQKMIHNYYFIKSMHLLNDGGIMAFITTRGFLSSEKNRVFREEMLKHGRIISIVRMPDNLFKTVDVGSDLIVYQKGTKYTEKFIETDDVFYEGLAEDFDVRGHHLRDTVITLRKNQYGKRVYYYRYNGKDMAKDLSDYLNSYLQALVKTRTPKPKMQKPTIPTKPQPATKPIPAKPTEPTKVSTPLHSREVLGCGDGPFAVLLGAPTNIIVHIGAMLLKRQHDNLTDEVRPAFLATYLSWLSAVSYSSGKTMTAHDVCKHYGDWIEDDEFKVLASIERKEDGKWVPADVFFKDVATTELGNGLSPQQALAASLNKFGKIDLPWMQMTSMLTREELMKSLEKALYFNPISGAYEEADRWLTGNVVDKAQVARQYLDNYRNGERREAERAILALEAAKPAPIPFCDIEAQFGARWIPIHLFEDFLYYLQNTTREEAEKTEWGKINLTYSVASDEYFANFWLHKREWKMDGHDAYETVMWALKGSVPSFSTKVDGKSVPDEGKRQTALRLVEQVCQAWQDFINRPKCEYLRKEIEQVYNAKFNNEVRPQYDGGFQTFPDLRLDNLGIKDLYESQKSAIWMLKRNGGGVCWHEVGTGKTLIMCISAYEMKRIGLVHKPVIIGLKANIGQIADTFRKAYPNARVLFPTNRDFSKEGRTNLLNQIKNNDWDCIIMTHEQFERIPSAEQTEMRLMQEEIDGLADILRECRDKKFYGRALSGLQKRKEKLELELANKRMKIAQRKDDVMDFCEMGIDHIFVDESHYFKNLAFPTRNMRVAGIGNPAGSQRAWKLLTAIRDIQHRTGRDLGATFLSGTIVSNSLTELYIIFKYLRPRALDKQNIHSFDAWASVFCQKKSDFELNIVGQIKTKERFASYVNLPELSKFLAQITDYRTTAMCGIDVPKEVQHFESAAPTPNQEEMLGKLMQFVGHGDWSTLGIRREAPANIDKALMLVATNVARQTALDPRILDDCQTYGDERDCKVRRCAENIIKMYRQYDEHKGTQFVFNDISTLDTSKWNMQKELRDLLVDEYGIPASEVAFVSEATTDTKRLELFDKMNRGEVRVLIGSTQKLGTGVNAQERAVAVHHLDIPWRPSDMEQRNGRALRKGNNVKEWGNNEVQVFIYATERTLDAYKFSLLKSKQMFIQQLNQGTLGIRRIDDDAIGGDGDNKAVSYAEFLSILSGNTDLLEKSKLDAKLMAMEKDRKQFYTDRSNAAREVERIEKEVAADEQWIRYALYDIKHAEVSEHDIPRIYGKENDCKTQKDSGRVISDMVDKFFKTDYTTVGEVGNVKIAAIRLVPEAEDRVGDIRFYVVGASGQYYCYPYNNGQPYRNNHERAAQFAYETVENLEKQIAVRRNHIEVQQKKLPDLREFTEKEWSRTAELADLKAKLDALKERITKDTATQQEQAA